MIISGVAVVVCAVCDLRISGTGERGDPPIGLGATRVSTSSPPEECSGTSVTGVQCAPPVFQQPQRPYPTPSCSACPAPAKALLHRAPPGSGALRRAGARQAPPAKG